MEASTGIEPVYTDLQSAASPLRQLAIRGGPSGLKCLLSVSSARCPDLLCKVDKRSDDIANGHAYAGHGDLAKGQAEKAPASFRPRQPIHERTISAPDGGSRYHMFAARRHALYTPARQWMSRFVNVRDNAGTESVFCRRKQNGTGATLTITGTTLAHTSLATSNGFSIPSFGTRLSAIQALST